VPHHRELIEAMLAYDLIGFQTEEDCENFLSYAQSDLGSPCMTASSFRARPHPRRGISDRHRSRTIRAVGREGVDPSGRVAAAAQPERREARDRRRPAGLFQGPDQPHQGVRPDVDAASAAARTASLLQIATPSRGAIEAYGNLQKRGREARQRRQRPHGEVDWTPIRYLNKGLARPCSRASIAPRRSAW
jgi:trehalose 6-phosphate synthase